MRWEIRPGLPNLAGFTRGLEFELGPTPIVAFRSAKGFKNKQILSRSERRLWVISIRKVRDVALFGRPA
jgi:hypothetical protein